jgi:hypothetical protein
MDISSAAKEFGSMKYEVSRKVQGFKTTLHAWDAEGSVGGS